VAYKTTVIMPGHVSLSQQHTGEGTSGSVQWSNACRLRTYLHRVYDADDKDTPEPDPNLRVLEVRKANWSAIGASISMSWHEGVFKPDMIEIEQQQKQPAEVLAADAEVVLRLLDGLLKGEHVSPNVNAPNNITATFRKRSRRFKAQPERLKAALDHLYDSGVIDNVEEGPPSKKREHVIRVKR
jgi:RecA-family ATPase